MPTSFPIKIIFNLYKKIKFLFIKRLSTKKNYSKKTKKSLDKSLDFKDKIVILLCLKTPSRLFKKIILSINYLINNKF
jgi:hypothetical protein